MLRQMDWQMLSFVGVSLINEYFIHIHLPRIYYWNGQREYFK